METEEREREREANKSAESALCVSLSLSFPLSLSLPSLNEGSIGKDKVVKKWGERDETRKRSATNDGGSGVQQPTHPPS
jgi:hypothetical protein